MSLYCRQNRGSKQRKAVMKETSGKCVNEDEQRTKTGRCGSHSLLPVLAHLVRYQTHQLLASAVQNTALPETGFSQRWQNLSDVHFSRVPGKDACCRFTGAARMLK